VSDRLGSVERREVVVVGGGPAGAATAIRLARKGRDVLVLERAAAWRWRASGVFTSPLTVTALRRLRLSDAAIECVARTIPAMRVETARGTTFRLTYGDDGSLSPAPVGLDRSAVDPLLLEAARRAGAEVREGVSVRGVREGVVTLSDGGPIAARVVVGADGLRSVVARDARVVRDPPLGGRAALTFHVEEPTNEAGRARDARMIVFDGGYVGLAPVPGGRVNVGIVLIDDRWRRRLRRDDAAATAAAVLAAVPGAADDPVRWDGPRICDTIEGAAPVGSRVSRRSGRDWLLVGDAAGFLDPFTGEGLHRSLATAKLASSAIDRFLGGDRDALRRYDRSLAALTTTKDLVSRLVQAFVARPALFEHAARRLAGDRDLRETMGLVIGDLTPASNALDPRFLMRLVRP
jgi:menaquinone-9 beta-reductase